VQVQVNGQAVQTLNPEASFVFLCAHYAKHAFPRLIWSHDLALLLARRAGEIDWHAVAGAASQGFTLPIRTALEDVESHWHVTLPPAAAAELAHFAPSHAQRAVYRLSTSPHALPHALWSVVSVPGITNKLRMLALHLFPSASYMRAHYGLAPAQSLLLASYYARRLVRWLGRLIGITPRQINAHNAHELTLGR
jgi:hypothetical protein